MKQDYALEWLDQMVYNLNPGSTNVPTLNQHQSQLLADKADQEQKRLISYLKRVVLKQHKKRRIQLIVNGYFHAVIRLLRCAESNLKFAS